MTVSISSQPVDSAGIAGTPATFSVVASSNAAPVFIAAGTGARGSNTCAPAYPGSIVAGDLLLAHIGYEKATATFTPPAGWTLLDSDVALVHESRVYYKIAAGTESGTISFSATASGGGSWDLMARIYQFRGAPASGFTESAAFGSGTAAAVSMNAVTSTVANDLAASFIYIQGSGIPASSTGESGGDWTSATGYAPSKTLALQTAALASPTTLSGGTASHGFSADWLNRSYGLLASGGLTYQWEISTNSGGSWASIAGEISSTYTLAARAAPDNGSQYRCLVTDSGGTVTSSVATLYVESSAWSLNIGGGPIALDMGFSAPGSEWANFDWLATLGYSQAADSGAAANIVAAGGIASAQAFGAPDISASLIGGSITSAQAFGAPVISPVIAGGTIASAEAFGAPVISASLIGGSIASAEGFGAPVISASLIGGSITSAQAFGAPVISPVIAGGTIASAEAFGAPVISASLIGGSVASAEAIGQPALAATVNGGSIASGEAFGQPTVGSAAASIIDAGGIASAEALGQPAIAGTISTAGIASAEAFGGAALAALIAGAGGIASAEAFGQPLVYDPNAPWDILGVGGIASAEAFGQPAVSGPAVPVAIVEPVFGGAPPLRRPRPGPGEFIYTPPQLVRGAGCIASAEAFGLPTITVLPTTRSRARREAEWFDFNSRKVA